MSKYSIGFWLAILITLILVGFTLYENEEYKKDQNRIDSIFKARGRFDSIIHNDYGK
jgi:heme/copper-type cytochrome/quinol oxidase subunit 4